ncbi:hypothetical protein [Streptomyces sp. 6N223]|uniref:hypothetical protein n=1 Tax=Streptomyces sp. 6N223 TaxID=3457412 RepID=UPI003FCF2564
MSGEADLSISQESVDLITRGLRAAMDELGVVGDATGALQGSGFDDMSLTEMEAGGGGLTEAFEGFCERWEWGVRGLIQDANVLAERLGLAAGMMWEEDQYWADTLAIGANAVLATGNPHATEEEVSGESFGDILTPDAPDYSRESLGQAGSDIAQTWQDTRQSFGVGDLGAADGHTGSDGG